MFKWNKTKYLCVPEKESSMNPLRMHSIQSSIPSVLKVWSEDHLPQFSFERGWFKMQIIKHSVNWEIFWKEISPGERNDCPSESYFPLLLSNLRYFQSCIVSWKYHTLIPTAFAMTGSPEYPVSPLNSAWAQVNSLSWQAGIQKWLSWEAAA